MPDHTPSALQVFLNEGTEVAQNAIDASIALPIEQGLYHSLISSRMIIYVLGDTEGVWINADPLPGAIVCNIGEMWETWTAGLYKSTLHRVIHRSSNYRVSVPFFFEPNFDALVEPTDAALHILRASKNAKEVELLKAQYPSVVYGEFLKSKVGGNFTSDSQPKERY
ncbi:hypothetical protein FRC16_007920 [Serendipita sp. 398]|nr:hypothetical protein FRC16_007920 [Serendipita sp. 398]